ncbi:MAG: hypothetical protein ACOYW7_12410 [Nitrospirota bacterium]
MRKKYRIVYRLLGEQIEVIEIVGIGKRDKKEIYRLVAKRLKKLCKTGSGGCSREVQERKK